MFRISPGCGPLLTMQKVQPEANEFKESKETILIMTSAFSTPHLSLTSSLCHAGPSTLLVHSRARGQFAGAGHDDIGEAASGGWHGCPLASDGAKRRGQRQCHVCSRRGLMDGGGGGIQATTTARTQRATAVGDQTTKAATSGEISERGPG